MKGAGKYTLTAVSHGGFHRQDRILRPIKLEISSTLGDHRSSPRFHLLWQYRRPKGQGQPCDGIEVSIMKHQRSWYLWLSRRDHLPRKLKMIVRVAHDIVTEERWSSIKLNADIPDRLFAWKPAPG